MLCWIKSKVHEQYDIFKCQVSRNELNLENEKTTSRPFLCQFLWALSSAILVAFVGLECHSYDSSVGWKQKCFKYPMSCAVFSIFRSDTKAEAWAWTAYDRYRALQVPSTHRRGSVGMIFNIFIKSHLIIGLLFPIRWWHRPFCIDQHK